MRRPIRRLYVAMHERPEPARCRTSASCLRVHVRDVCSTRSGVKRMLYVFGFRRLGVAVSDLYFKTTNPIPGQEGSERGVRLELRLLETGTHHGSILDARPIVIDRPIW